MLARCLRGIEAKGTFVEDEIGRGMLRQAPLRPEVAGMSRNSARSRKVSLEAEERMLAR